MDYGAVVFFSLVGYLLARFFKGASRMATAQGLSFYLWAFPGAVFLGFGSLMLDSFSDNYATGAYLSAFLVGFWRR